MSGRAAAFLVHVQEPLRSALAALPELETQLESVLRRAQAEHPSVSFSEPEFLAHLAARLPAQPPSADALTAVRAGDLLLAFACARRNALALSEFDRLFSPTVAQVVSRRGGDRAMEDEVLQRVRSRILVDGADGVARISDYTGRGPLAGWVMAVAVRTIIDLRRSEKPDLMLGEDMLPELASEDLELAFIKSRYRGEFKAAFGASLQALSAKDRNVLRLKLLDGLNIDEIGKLYGTHRATVARWIAAAREALATGTRERMAAALKLDAAELDSLLRAINSQLDVSISRLLRPDPE